MLDGICITLHPIAVIITTVIIPLVRILFGVGSWEETDPTFLLTFPPTIIPLFKQINDVTCTIKTTLS